MYFQSINRNQNRFYSVESMDSETNKVIANFSLADINNKILRYINETKPSTKHTPVKQNLSTILCLML